MRQSQNTDIPNFDATGATNIFIDRLDVKENFVSLKECLEAGLGVMWDMGFCDDEWHMYFTAGWEFIHWGEQNQMFRWAASPAVIGGSTQVTSFNGEMYHQGGDLNMQGLNVGLRFDF